MPDDTAPASEPQTEPWPADLAALANFCAKNTEFVKQWERLTHKRLGGSDKERWAFVAFVKETIWDRMPLELFTPTMEASDAN